MSTQNLSKNRSPPSSRRWALQTLRWAEAPHQTGGDFSTALHAEARLEHHLARFWLCLAALLLCAGAAFQDHGRGLLVCALALVLPFTIERGPRATLASVIALAGELLFLAVGIYASVNVGLMVAAGLLLAIHATVVLSHERAARRVVVGMPPFLLMVLDAAFVLLDFSTPAWDQSRHAHNVFAVLDALTQPHHRGIVDALAHYDFYTPLVYWVAVPFAALLGRSYTAVALSLPLLWVPLGFYLCYRLCARSFRATPATASTAAFVLMGGALASGLAKQLMLDLPALVMIVAYHVALERSGHLQRKKGALFAGAIGGLAMLTKPHVVFYIGPMLAAAVVRQALKVRKRPARLPHLIDHVLRHALGFLLVAGPWFALHMGFFRYELRGVAHAGLMEGDPRPATLASGVWYLRRLFDALTLPIVAIMVYGWVRALRAKGATRFFARVYGVTFVLAYAAFTATWNKDPRYGLPLTFLMLPGLVAAFHRSTPRVRRALLFGAVAWTALLNVSQDVDLHFLKNVRVGPLTVFSKSAYTLPPSPRAPWAATNPPQTLAAFVSLYGRAFPHLADAPLRLERRWTLGPPGLNALNWRLYAQDLEPSSREVEWVEPAEASGFVKAMAVGDDSIAVAPPPSVEELIFLRDAEWPDDYLMAVEHRAGGEVLVRLGEQTELHANLYADVLSADPAGRVLRTIRLAPRAAEPLPELAQRSVRLRFRAVHAGAARWPLRLEANLLRRTHWIHGALAPLGPLGGSADGTVQIDAVPSIVPASAHATGPSLLRK